MICFDLFEFAGLLALFALAAILAVEFAPPHPPKARRPDADR